MRENIEYLIEAYKEIIENLQEILEESEDKEDDEG